MTTMSLCMRRTKPREGEGEGQAVVWGKVRRLELWLKPLEWLKRTTRFGFCAELFVSRAVAATTTADKRLQQTNCNCNCNSNSKTRARHLLQLLGEGKLLVRVLLLNFKGCLRLYCSRNVRNRMAHCDRGSFTMWSATYERNYEAICKCSKGILMY